MLDYFAGRTNVFVFGNAESFRYYLPAYTRHGLRTGRTTLRLAPSIYRYRPGRTPR